MAGNSIKIHASVKDDASRQVTGIRDKLRNLGKEAKSGILAGVGIGAGISAFNMMSGAISGTVGYLKEAVAAGAEEVAEIATLTEAIKQNDAAWDGNIDAVEKVIGQRQKLGFEDAQQRASLQGLVSVTGDLNKALELNRTAMDLSRLKGIDLRVASELIGKVYAGNLGTLSRYGIVLERGATATEAIAEIQRRAAGQAEAYGNTTAGAMETAQLALGDLQEDIGKKLLPVMTELALFTRDTLVPALGSAVDGLSTVGGAVDDAHESMARYIDFTTGKMGDVERIAEALGISYMEARDKVKTANEEMGVSAAELADTVERKVKAQELIHATTLDAIIAEYQSKQPALNTAATRIAAIPREKMVAEHQAIRQAAYQTQVEIAKGLLDGQNEPKVAMDAALQIMEEELTQNEETMRLKGQIQMLEVNRGIASKEGKQGAVIAIDAALQAARDRLTFISSDFYKGGYNIGVAWANGLGSSIPHAKFQARQLTIAAKAQMMGLSPPKEGPLKDIDKGGFNIGKAWAEGLGSAKSAVGSHVAALAGFARDGLSGGIGGGMSGGGGKPGGVTEIHTHVHLNDREIAYAVNRINRFILPASGRVMPL